jgi:hypothetical protein
MNRSEFNRSYNSFSGVDMKATFQGVVIGELQALSYSITREKAPIYTLGSADPRAFSRGKRGIAGTLIFVMFDRHALLETLSSMRFQSDVDDIMPGYSGGQEATDPIESFKLQSNSARTPGSLITENQESSPNSVAEDQVAISPWYVDQIPGFDITLMAANEYGALAIMRIFGAEILNEGYGISIDDIVSEQQMTYIARAVAPWKYLSPRSDMALLGVPHGAAG